MSDDSAESQAQTRQEEAEAIRDLVSTDDVRVYTDKDGNVGKVEIVYWDTGEIGVPDLADE